MSELNELDAGMEDLVALAMGKTKRENLAVRFYVHPTINEQKTREQGRQIFEDVDWIEIRIPGDRDTLQRAATDEDKKRFAHIYVAWKRNQSQEAAEGTPLREWAAITRSQAEELGSFGIRTVEHLAGMPDSNLQRVGPLMAIRQQARDWLAAQKDTSVLTKLRSENDELRSRLTALENMLQTQSREIEAARVNGGTLPAVAAPDPRLAAMEAQIAALVAAVQSPEPKRRGRPPKAAPAAEE